MKKFILIFLTLQITFSVYSSHANSTRTSSLNVSETGIITNIKLPDSEAYSPENQILLEKMSVSLAKIGYTHTHAAIAAHELMNFTDNENSYWLAIATRCFSCCYPSINEKMSIENNLTLGERLINQSLKLSEIHCNLTHTRQTSLESE